MPHGARAHRGGVPQRGRDPRGGAVNAERVEALIAAARPRRGARRRARRRRRLARQPEVQEAILELLPPAADGAAARSGRSSTTTRSRSSATTSGSACASCRRRSRATARSSRRASCMMPSYVNIGAWVGPRTMVDTWATVGSGAQIGADVHLAGGVGIGGVLEPPGARPVIVEDGAFIGSRCDPDRGRAHRRGRRARAERVADRVGPDHRRDRRRAASSTAASCRRARSSFPARGRRSFPPARISSPCALIIGWRSESTDLKVSLNDALREHGLGG